MKRKTRGDNISKKSRGTRGRNAGGRELHTILIFFHIAGSHYRWNENMLGVSSLHLVKHVLVRISTEISTLFENLSLYSNDTTSRKSNSQFMVLSYACFGLSCSQIMTKLSLEVNYF